MIGIERRNLVLELPRIVGNSEYLFLDWITSISYVVRCIGPGKVLTMRASSIFHYNNSKAISQRRPDRDVLKTVLKVLSAKPNAAENFKTSRVADFDTR